MADQETRPWTGRCLVFIVTVSVSCGFNLDPRFSVIKRGPPGTYFGYSVTEHQITRDDGTVSENLLLVGAPKEKVILTNGQPTGGAIYKYSIPTPSEKVDDQWLGVSLHSSGKVVVTCAHRYIRDNAGIGICHTLLQTLDYQSPWFPCLGKSHTNFLEDFGLCQAGMSATLGQDESMLIGAPGSIFWRGVVFQVNVTEEFGADRTQYNTPFPVNPNEEGADEAQLPPSDKYSYLGYSVATGRFDASRNLYFVSGAPRSHNKGEVVFFRKVERNAVLRYEPEQKLQGTLDFSGFGSSLLAVDLNNDTFEDLIVGAPYYYDKGRGGAIYIYPGGRNMINKDSPYTLIVSREMSDKECEELGCQHARFGTSLTKLGDINKDGYQDFAVGAPFEGSGTVYIYHGSKNGVVKMYAQRIPASEMPGGEQMQSFGHSLSGGRDLDNNGYPDLLVGAYETNQVALIRTRAVIRLLPEMSTSPEMTDLSEEAICPHDNAQRRCIKLDVCLTFTAEPADSFSTRPTIKYRVDAERSRSFSRLEMARSTDASKKFVEGSVRLYRQGTGNKACLKEIAYLKDVFADKLNPMELTVTFSLEEQSYTRPNPGEPLPDINNYPILSTAGTAAGDKPNTVSVMVDFVKECGDDNKCDSNLQFEATLAAPLKDKMYELQGGSDDSRAELEFTVTNLGEAAYLTRVYIQKPPGMSYSGGGGKGQDSNVKCTDVDDDETLIVCDDIGNPLRTDNTVSFQVRLSNRIESTSDVMNITVWVNTSSTEKTPANDKKVFHFMVIKRAELKLDVNVRPDDQILCAGEPRGASAMQTEEDIGTAVNHTYIVEKGVAKCRVSEGDVNPEDIEAVAPEAAPVRVDSFQPLNDGSSSRRRKREAGESRVRRAQGSLAVLGCRESTAICRKITCRLGNLQGGSGYVQITLRARLWESTLLSDYRKAGDVQISSYGKVTIPDYLDIVQDTSDDEREAVTYAVPDFKDAGAAELKWWVILLAVLGGILLLVIIIFVLYKVGFFKRKRPEDMQMYQAEKKQQKMLEDYEEEDT
ncbi:hypothetical protein BaRGS_00031657 [Batillaria attramentaria]|uniref:Integrin alpha-2 domain-containing protein n=1 Tax=Batillaria attramentaria TaxID=370345 RepID=A0ABD0JQB1_9CAEN